MVFVTSHLVLGMEVAVIDDLTADVCLADVVAVASALWEVASLLRYFVGRIIGQQTCFNEGGVNALKEGAPVRVLGNAAPSSYRCGDNGGEDRRMVAFYHN